MKIMNAFEKWQVGVMIAQSAILLATFLAAFYIGLKQNEINEGLLNLNYAPSVEIVYDGPNKKFIIFNKGKTNMFLFGDQLADTDKDLQSEGRQIAPGGSYYLLANAFEQYVLKKIGQNGSDNLSFSIFLKGENNVKYIVKNNLYIVIESGKISVHTQTLSYQVVSSW